MKRRPTRCSLLGVCKRGRTGGKAEKRNMIGTKYCPLFAVAWFALAGCSAIVCGQDKTPPTLIYPKTATARDCFVPNVLALVSAYDNCTASNKLVFTQSPPAGTSIAAGGNQVADGPFCGTSVARIRTARPGSAPAYGVTELKPQAS